MFPNSPAKGDTNPGNNVPHHITLMNSDQLTDITIKGRKRKLLKINIGLLLFKQSCTYMPIKYFISSPEPSGSQGELIVYPYSGVRCRRRQQCLNIFSSETALPIKAKFYVEPPWEGGMKVYIKGPCHMTKMATMPIYGKNL